MDACDIKKKKIQRFWARFYFFWCKVKEDAAFYAISNGWSSCSNNLILCSGLDGLCHFSFFSFLLFNRCCELDEVCITYFTFTGPTSFAPVRFGSMIADYCRKGSSSHPRSKYTAAACQKFKWQQGFQRWDDSEWRRNIKHRMMVLRIKMTEEEWWFIVGDGNEWTTHIMTNTALLLT